MKKLLSCEKGLTLVEVMVVILIFGIVSSLIFRFIDFGMTSLSKGSDHVDNLANLRLAAYRITDEVRNARNINLLSAPTDPKTLDEYIWLDGDTITHDVSSTPQSLRVSDNLISDLSYTLTPQNGKYVLTIHLTGVEGQSLTTDVLLNNMDVGALSVVNFTGAVLEFDHETPMGGGGGADAVPTISIDAPLAASEYDESDLIEFSGIASDDEDGDISADIEWSSSIDGNLGIGSAYSTTALSVGTHTITASVSDTGGWNVNDSITLTVNGSGGPTNTVPIVAILSPSSASTHNITDNISFSGNASDNEDGDISSSIEWSSSLDGSLGSGAVVVNMLSAGSHVITASITDSGALTDSDQITITINEGNQPPVATNQLVSCQEDGATVNFILDAMDPNGDALSYSLSNTISPSRATFGGIAPNLTVAGKKDGTYTFIYTVSDGEFEDSATVTVVVSP